MKNKFDLILNISVFVLGVIFIVLWSNGKGVFDLVSMAVGILFIVFSAWSLVALLCQEKRMECCRQKLLRGHLCRS